MLMANHISNLLTINASEDMVSKVREYIKGSNGESISFQSFIPEPEGLDGEVTINMYGHDISIPTCFAWRFAKWGPKWDAWDSREISSGCLFFKTANNTPVPAMKNLSQAFPEVTFHITFADEYAGQYCGEYTLIGGKMVDEVFIEYEDSDRAMEYFFLTHEGEREFWKKDENGSWYDIDAELDEEDYDEEDYDEE